MSTLDLHACACYSAHTCEHTHSRELYLHSLKHSAGTLCSSLRHSVWVRISSPSPLMAPLLHQPLSPLSQWLPQIPLASECLPLRKPPPQLFLGKGPPGCLVPYIVCLFPGTLLPGWPGSPSSLTYSPAQPTCKAEPLGKGPK